MWDHLAVESQDPEERIAELERRLGEARDATHQFGTGEASVSFPNDAVQQARSFDAPLAPAPRRVPLRFLLAEALPFRWWYLFAIFMVAIPPIIVWMMQPLLLLPAAVLVVLVIYGVHIRAAWTRVALLKWGRVATVTGTDVLSQATYYGGTTYSNVVLPVARGWTVTRPVWSGPKTKTRISYQLGGYRGDLVVGGREYVDGVVLADERHPQRALCVTSFPYDLTRDADGNWTGRLRLRLQIGMVCWLVVMVSWIGGAALLHRNYGAYLDSSPTTALPGHAQSTPRPTTTTTAAAGEAVLVNGANEIRSIVCSGNDVTVNGAANRVDITGHCLSVTVSGSANHVTIDAADAITANGIDNVVTYRTGSPNVVSGGISNVVEPG